jgi:hypothetical protein
LKAKNEEASRMKRRQKVITKAVVIPKPLSGDKQGWGRGGIRI